VLALTLAALAVLVATAAATAGRASSSATGTLVVDKSFDLKTADPQRQYEPTGGIVDRALYDTLLVFKGADVAHPQPSVATKFTVSKDATTYTFTLRKDVKFSDGAKLTSADVVFSFNRLVNLKREGAVHGRPQVGNAEPRDPRARREHVARHRQLEAREGERGLRCRRRRQDRQGGGVPQLAVGR
jgi:ABC-type transport system substrate-binding protein